MNGDAATRVQGPKRSQAGGYDQWPYPCRRNGQKVCYSGNRPADSIGILGKGQE